MAATQDLDRLFSALADPHRRAMLERLTRGPASVSELAQPTGIALPSVMQHLGVLEASGLITSTKVGRVRTCELQPDALSAVERWIGERRALWVRRLDRLGDYLDQTSDTPPSGSEP